MRTESSAKGNSGKATRDLSWQWVFQQRGMEAVVLQRKRGTGWRLSKAVLLLLSLVMTYKAWISIFETAIHVETCNYILLIPGVVAWLAWARRDRLPLCSKDKGLPACFLLAVGGIFFFFDEHHTSRYLWHAGAIFLVLGSLLSVIGSDGLFRFFSVAFTLFLLIALPDYLVARMSSSLQVVNTQFIQAVLELLGYQTSRLGNVMRINGVDVMLSAYFSGLRSGFIVLIAGLLLFTFVRLLSRDSRPEKRRNLVEYSTPLIERRSVRADNVPLEQATVGGLKPSQIYDCFWAAYGVQPIRCGEKTELAKTELFLLTPPDSLVMFDFRQLMETMNGLKNWLKPRVVFIKLQEKRGDGYRERVITDDQSQFLRFQRMYGGFDRRSTIIALTPEPSIARAWQISPNPVAGFACLRKDIPESRLAEISLPGCSYSMVVASDLRQCVHDLIETWERPNAALTRLHEMSRGVWADKDSWIDPAAKIVGPIWIGAGRVVDKQMSLIGPAVLWDDPTACLPRNSRVTWEHIKTRPTRRRRSRQERKEGFALSAQKRAFDIFFALFAIAITAPLYPLIMLAIWLEDGRPFFFAHRRETLGGSEFPCLKFRSMFRNAEQIKAEYQKKNQVDGPQFFIEDDPRHTRVGRVLRKSKLDELPQFLNVLVGHMSVVGPRPSPFAENQFCPVWREARLSVRPGITGLWQLKRTRQKGLDFQEWIKYDLEYVENSSWPLDLWILWHTVCKTLRELF